LFCQNYIDVKLVCQTVGVALRHCLKLLVEILVSIMRKRAVHVFKEYHTKLSYIIFKILG
jgi:hypothetical protein